MRCPKCGNALMPAKDGGGFCAQCGELFQVGVKLHYSSAAEQEAVNFCRDLAARVNWVKAVFDVWPGPIAHEAFRLKTILEEGQIIGAIWKLKDLAEVLLKFPAVIMARDFLENGADEDVKKEIRSFFFSKPLSMGDWSKLAGDRLAHAAPAEAPEKLMAPGIAGIFRQTSGKRKPTRAYNLIRDIIQWRNDEIGHGALRLNVREFQPELESFVIRLNEVFQEHEDQRVWSDLAFRIIGPEPLVLRGAASIRTRHENEKPGAHITDDVDVELVRRGRSLILSPFLSVKRCQVCRKMDVFFFDSKKAEYFYFLDYLAGHRMSRPGHLETRLAKYARDVAAVRDDLNENEIMGRVARRTVDALLMEKSLEAAYISPSFLRDRLKTFIESHDRGLFWLRAPAHCGKSVFVNGLLPAFRMESRSLVEGLKTAAFFIKREYRYHPAQFKERLKETITGKAGLNLVAGSHELPELNLYSENPSQSFAGWIAELLKWRPDDSLLICIDGLDELSKTDDASILEFIPSPDQFPSRLFILLTSRSEVGCPAWVWKGMETKLEKCKGHMEILEFALDCPEYRRLLRDYFYGRLTERIHDRIHLHLKTALNDKPEIRFTNDAHAIQDIPIKLNPVKILAEASLQGFKTGKNLPGICQAVINPVIELFEAAFETVLERADNRFLFVSHQVNLLRDASADIDTLGRLPSGEALFRQYLDELKRVLTDQQWAYAKRVLLIMAAGEEAYKSDFNQSDCTLGDAEWSGIPLGVLCDLMGEPDIGSARLIFILYSLKEVLSTWRSGNDGESLYRLGLKDFAAVIRSEWQGDLARLHREITEMFFTAWKGHFGEINLEHPGTYYCFRYLLAHASLCENPEIKEMVWSHADLADAYKFFAQKYSKESHYNSASDFFEQEIKIYLCLVEGVKDVAYINSLAIAYMNRGVNYADQGRYSEAIADYNRYITLMEQIRSRNEVMGAWTPSMNDDLAGAYVNRGNAYTCQDRNEESLSDYCFAIELMEEVKAVLEPRDEWPMTMAHHLAGAYTNRGGALINQGRYEDAFTDFGRAIEIREKLGDTLESKGEGWPLFLTDGLVNAYMTRAIAHSNQGRAEETLDDISCVIELMEGLRMHLEPKGEWPPSMANDLAKAYQIRGKAVKNQGHYDEAIVDTGNAIALMEGLRVYLSPRMEWPPSMVNDLASAYMSRGNIFKHQGRHDEAIIDYDYAIELMVKLRDILESMNILSHRMIYDLASVYLNRGDAKFRHGYNEDAIDDFSQGIELIEGFRAELESRGDWPPLIAIDLSRAYTHRGSILQNENRYNEAFTDYVCAIAIQESLLFDMNDFQIIPLIANGFSNAVFLTKELSVSEASIVNRAEAFLKKMCRSVDMEQLPNDWQNKLDDLQKLIDEKKSK